MEKRKWKKEGSSTQLKSDQRNRRNWNRENKKMLHKRKGNCMKNKPNNSTRNERRKRIIIWQKKEEDMKKETIIT